MARVARNIGRIEGSKGRLESLAARQLELVVALGAGRRVAGGAAGGEKNILTHGRVAASGRQFRFVDHPWPGRGRKGGGSGCAKQT